MDALLQVLYPPFTHSISFISHNLADTSNKFHEWVVRHGTSREKIKEINVLLDKSLLQLKPLRAPFDKMLLLQTDSDWIAFITNHKRGSGEPSYIRRLCSLTNSVSILATYRPHTLRKTVEGNYEGHYGITELYFYEPTLDPALDPTRRIIQCGVFDSGRWEFIQWGEPLPFENLEYYERKKVKDKFNAEILNEYLLHFGIRFFDESFYRPDKQAFLIYS